MSVIKLIFAALFWSAALSSIAFSESLDQCKGLKVPPYPVGYEKTGEHLVSSGGKNKYVISTVKHDSQWTWWLEKITQRDIHGKEAQKEVRLVFLEPELPQGYTYVHSACRVGSGPLRRDIIAMVKFEPDKAWYDSIYRAWKVNVETEQIETFPSSGITCRNLSWGE